QIEEGLRARASLQLDEARRALSAASELLPNSPKALANYALVLAEQGDFPAAARVFDRARAMARDDPDVQTVHARFLFFTRGPIASLEALQPLLERHPE